MGSLGRALRHSNGVGRARGLIAAVLVAGLLVTQSMEVSDSAATLGAGGVWILPSLCLAALGAVLGFWAGRLRAAAGWRVLARRYAGQAVLAQVLAVGVAMLLIGPALTALGPRAYALDPGSWAYLLNLVGVPTYPLPGVFADNNVPDIVNQWMWLPPFFVPLLALACVLPQRRSAWWIPAGLFGAVALAALVGQAIDFVPASPDGLLALLVQGDGLTLVLSVLLGLLMAAAREKVPLSGWLGVAALTVLAAGAWRGGPAWLALPAFRIAESLPAAYLGVGAALARLPLSRLAARAEPVLPGLLLLAFPLQQVASSQGPHPQRTLLNLALAVPVAVAAAAGWWHWVGRRLVGWSPLPPVAIDEPPRLGLRDAIRRARQVRSTELARGMALSVALSAIFVLVMALLYIASAADEAGG